MPATGCAVSTRARELGDNEIGLGTLAGFSLWPTAKRFSPLRRKTHSVLDCLASARSARSNRTWKYVNTGEFEGGAATRVVYML